MKKDTSNNQKFDPKEGFEIKNPTWTFLVCLLGTVGGLIVFFVLAYLKSRGIMDTLYIGYIFLGVSVLSAVGVYVCVYEKLIYSDGVYKYHRPFGKNQSASVNEIGSVKFFTEYYRMKYGRTGKNMRVLFCDKKKNVLIKILDDGTMSNNEMLKRSLEYHDIKIIHEEKHNY